MLFQSLVLLEAEHGIRKNNATKVICLLVLSIEKAVYSLYC